MLSQMFFYANNAILINQADFWEKSYILRLQNGKLNPEKSQNDIDLEACPVFLKDIARVVVSAGKSLQLISHIPRDYVSLSGSSNFREIEGFGRSKVDYSIGEVSKNIGCLTLPEVFCLSLVGLIGDGSRIHRYFREDNPLKPNMSQLLGLFTDKKMLSDENSCSMSSPVNSEQIWFQFLVNTVFHKRMIDQESSSKDFLNLLDDSHSMRSFCPENPVITVCQTLLDKNHDSHDKLNVSKNFHLPPLNDEGLRDAIFGEVDGFPSAVKNTDYSFGFQFGELECARLEDDMETLEVIYPFPTLLPYFQDDFHISGLFPFQKNSTVTSSVLNWVQGTKPKATPLPVVIVQECLIAYIKKQVDYVGKHILLKLMNDWRLMDLLGVLRAIYLLGSGDLLQQFLSVVYDKLDKGESWDDDFELNTILQVGDAGLESDGYDATMGNSFSHLWDATIFYDPPPLDATTQNLDGYLNLEESIRNSSDGNLLSAPDCLSVSITKDISNGGVQNNKSSLLSSTLRARNNCFGIDALDLLNFTYKVPWPLELIANSEAIKKYNQVMGFLLKVKRAKFVLDKARRWMWKVR
ncbi:hypothetical protein GIB67_029690 [Kingdonia uniflora]|uniref:Gamma-tubulin complex component n=1 Tax=Kingdonia uniflora TaxID=39325 RepID=A0A7J7LLG7_9MAGN|nr:hypothetical protein GIB67_029690 [Kingdonia uniflora]